MNKETMEEEKEENHGKIDIEEVSDNSSISLDLGYGLISMVDSNEKKVCRSFDFKDNRNKKASFQKI